MSTQEKKMLQCQSRCYICTKRRHHSRDCKSKRTCFRCKGRHYTSICERDKDSLRQQTNNNKSNDSKKSNDTKDSKGDNEQTQQPNTSRTTTNILTATVVVNSKRNNYYRVKCRLLFDSGSQRTYVSRTLVEATDAETIRTEYLALGTFGALTTECLPRDVVSITVSDRADQESIQIEQIIVEKICDPIQSYELDITESTKMRLDERNSAHTYHADDEIVIGILIGLDYYWSIVMGGVIRVSLGPVAIASKFGYILSGPIQNRKFSNVTTSACAARAPPIAKSMTNVMTIDLKPDEIIKSLINFWTLKA